MKSSVYIFLELHWELGKEVEGCLGVHGVAHCVIKMMLGCG